MSGWAQLFNFRRSYVETPEERLERIVRETRASFACEQYRRRRAAALKGKRRLA